MKRSLSFTILCATSVIIWFTGPFLGAGQYYPLLGPEKRIYLITLLLIFWAVKVFVYDNGNKKKPPLLTAEQLKKILALQSRFKGAMSFLKKTALNKQGKKINLFQLPWYLLIGPQNSGKTTLLANSNINYVLAKQFKSENLKQLNPSDNYDWWVTRNLVLVDVPSSHTLEEKNHYLWQGFLDLIKKYRKKKPLNGIVIALNLPELIKQDLTTQKESLLISLRKCILTLNNQFDSRTPFYFIITKCDQLPGFTEFFGDYTSDELAQTWGITIPPLNNNENLADVFTHRFNLMIKRLNKQLISRLHQERNPAARPYIKDFPLQVERIKEAISHLLKNIQLSHFNLQGVYLTSAIQTPTHDEQPAPIPALSHTQSSNALQVLNPPTSSSHSFFIKQLIMFGLLNTFEHAPVPNSSKKRWKMRLIYATSLSFLVIAIFLLGYDFQQGIRSTYSLQNLLSQYQIALQHENDGIKHLAKTLPLLDSLENIAKRHGYYSLSPLTFYTKKSQQTADKIYHQALQAIVIVEIKNFLEAYLKNPSDKNPDRLYAVLKTYLILGNTQTLDISFALNAIDPLLLNHLNVSEHASLMHHLQAALTELQPVMLNEGLIAKTRKLLFDFQPAQLAFIVLKNMGNNNFDSNINLGTNQNTTQVLTTKQVVNQIPNIYTAAYFQTIASTQIPQAAREALNGNTILGEAPIKPESADETALTSELEKQYVAHYIDIWESLLANVQIITPNNLAQTDLILATLTSPSSPLIQFLQSLQQNTTLTPVLNASPKLQTLNALLQNINNPGNALYQIFASMKALHQYLQTILNTSNPSEAAFIAAKTRMQNLAANDPINQMIALTDKSPEPIKYWLEKLTDHSWRYMLEESSHHIENRWKTMVVPTYAAIANYFPLKSDAKEEIELQKFTDFFKPQGILTTFYQTYLKPFTDESSKEWEWRRLDNRELPLSKTILPPIQYALQLQHALFANDDNKLLVPFILQLVYMDKETHSVSLNLNGQSVTYQKSASRTPRGLTWPGNSTLPTTTINFTSPGRLPTNETIQGDWAWFRLVNQATQTLTANNELILTLIMNNHIVKYKILTQSDLNPFITSNWEKLQLPGDLG